MKSVNWCTSGCQLFLMILLSSFSVWTFSFGISLQCLFSQLVFWCGAWFAVCNDVLVNYWYCCRFLIEFCKLDFVTEMWTRIAVKLVTMSMDSHEFCVSAVFFFHRLFSCCTSLIQLSWGDWAVCCLALCHLWIAVAGFISCSWISVV